MVIIILLQAIPIAIIPLWALYRTIKPVENQPEEDKALIDWSDAWQNVKGLFKHDISKTITE